MASTYLRDDPSTSRASATVSEPRSAMAATHHLAGLLHGLGGEHEPLDVDQQALPDQSPDDARGGRRARTGPGGAKGALPRAPRDPARLRFLRPPGPVPGGGPHPALLDDQAGDPFEGGLDLSGIEPEPGGQQR